MLLVLVFLAYLVGSHAEEEYGYYYDDYYYYNNYYYDDYSGSHTTEELPSEVSVCPGPDKSLNICEIYHYGEGGLNIEF